MRIRLNAVLTELDRRRHHATDVKHLAREHAGAVAVGALVLAAIVATPVLKVRRRRQRRWAHQGVTLTDRARCLGRALGRVAHDPDRLAAQPPPRMLGIPPKTLAALLTTAQIPLRPGASDVAAMRPRRAVMACIRGALPMLPALLRQMGRGFHRGLHRSHEAQGSAY